MGVGRVNPPDTKQKNTFSINGENSPGSGREWGRVKP